MDLAGNFQEVIRGREVFGVLSGTGIDALLNHTIKTIIFIDCAFVQFGQAKVLAAPPQTPPKFLKWLKWSLQHGPRPCPRSSGHPGSGRLQCPVSWCLPWLVTKVPQSSDHLKIVYTYPPPCPVPGAAPKKCGPPPPPPWGLDTPGDGTRGGGTSKKNDLSNAPIAWYCTSNIARSKG